MKKLDKVLKIFDNPNCNSSTKIMNTILGKTQKSKLCKKDYSHKQKDFETVAKILSSAIEQNKTGINILLYGGVGTGKTEFAKLVCNSAKIPVYEVKTVDSDFEETTRRERLVDLYSKQYVLANTRKSCILFDEAEDVMNRGFGGNGEASKGYLNDLLDKVSVPVIWTTNNIYDVDPAFLRRMRSISLRFLRWRLTISAPPSTCIPIMTGMAVISAMNCLNVKHQTMSVQRATHQSRMTTPML